MLFAIYYIFTSFSALKSNFCNSAYSRMTANKDRIARQCRLGLLVIVWKLQQPQNSKKIN